MIRVRVGVTFNVSVYFWSNYCRRSKCRRPTFKEVDELLSSQDVGGTRNGPLERGSIGTTNGPAEFIQSIKSIEKAHYDKITNRRIILYGSITPCHFQIKSIECALTTDHG